MRIRNVLQECEALLRPTMSAASVTGSARGKGEWKSYVDGTRRCKVSISGLKLSEGAVLHLAVAGVQFAELPVHGGRARYRRESERGEGVPEVEPKQLLQISYGGQVILEGEFYSE